MLEGHGLNASEIARYLRTFNASAPAFRDESERLSPTSCGGPP